ncbi:TonB-dependent receptor [Brevundimonas sp.]|uniref:TonB-dependent receptor n=1 Tax=Brevundimonas sp. TaxID=1871086 RepID=UPI0035AF3058
MSARLLSTASLLALAAASPAFAQEAAGPATLDEIVVTAARTEQPRSAMPNTVEVIGSAEIAEQTALGASAVETVAALVPSFSPTRQKLSGFGESLRGRSPLYLVDGVPQSTPLRDDSRDGYTIDPFFIDRVEVIFGSNAIQGIGATGGVVNYVTARKPAEGAGLTGRMMAQVTTDDEVQGDGLGYKLAAIGGQDLGTFDLTLGAAFETRGAYYDAEGRRIGFDGAQGEVQDSRALSLFARAGWDLGDDRRLEGWINRFDLEGDGDYVTVPGNRATGVPTTAVRGAPEGFQPSNEVTSAALTYTDRNLFGGVLRAQVIAHDYAGVFGGGRFASFQDPAIAPAGMLFDQSANNSEKLGFKVDWQGHVPGAAGLKALVGVDGLRDETYQELVLTGRNWVPETAYESLSPFLQLNQSLLADRLTLSAGVRHESARLKVDDYETLYFYGPQTVAGGEPGFEETLFNVGAAFEVRPDLLVYGSFAQGFTMPDVGRVLRAISTPNEDVDDFLDLEPVITDNTEVGIEYRGERLELSAAAFRSEADRGALYVRRPSGDLEVERRATRIDGLELKGLWRATDAITVGGSFAALDGRSASVDGGPIDRDLDGANISPDRLLLWGEYETGPLALRLQAQNFLSRGFEGEDPVNDFEGYALVDALVRYSADFGTVSLGVQNLLDEQYVSYFSDTQGPTDNLRYFAGRGRTATLTLTRGF